MMPIGRVSEYDGVSTDESSSSHCFLSRQRISSIFCPDDVVSRQRLALARDALRWSGLEEGVVEQEYENMPDAGLFDLSEDECSGITAFMNQKREEDLEYDTFDVSCENNVLRLTVGDFDLIPEHLDVDEERCLVDGQYRCAVRFLEEAHNFVMREATFDTDKQYRDAVNVLVGAEVGLSCAFDGMDDNVFFWSLDNKAAWIDQESNVCMANAMILSRLRGQGVPVAVHDCRLM